MPWFKKCNPAEEPDIIKKLDESDNRKNIKNNFPPVHLEHATKIIQFQVAFLPAMTLAAVNPQLVTEMYLAFHATAI